MRARPNAVASAPEVTRAVANAPASASVEAPGRDRNSAAPEPSLVSAPAPATRTVTIIDGTSGRRREIVIPETSNVIGFDQQLSEAPLPTAAALGVSPRAPVRSLPAR